MREALKVTGASSERFIDFGVELQVVRQDADGISALPGKPPLVAVATHRFGGIWDVEIRRFIRETENPIIWYVSEKQARVICGGDNESRTLIYSAEGGGKTVTGAMWLIVQVLQMAQAGEFMASGCTAPTHERLQTLVKAFGERIPIDAPKSRRPGALATYYSDDRELRFKTGHVVQFRSTKRQSAATGSPIQGFTWGLCFSDELQDSAEDGADADIEARLRGARFSRRLCTATAKDSPSWRAFRDSKLTTADWRIERIRYSENPFVWPEHWETMKRNMSPREWQRRGLAMDVGPERQTYNQWERARNLKPVPDIGALDVTSRLLQRWGPNHTVLAGHDPGKIYNVTTFFKAFMLPGKTRPTWWAVGELVTHRTTTEQHVKELLKYVGDNWRCNQLDWRGKRSMSGDTVFVRADPYSNSGNDANSPDRSVYTIFKNSGIAILPAAMTADATKVKVARVPKEAGIGMVNNLLNSDGIPYLMVACDDRMQPLAPKMVEAMELSERDGDGNAETDKKDESDLSHYAATVRYALWVLEKPRAAERAAS